MSWIRSSRGSALESEFHVERGDCWDVLVVGAGHAGCEAALAAARLGCRTCLITIDVRRLAEMSCNPAIGGLGKSQIVRELDALGGEMARAADASAIQFRRLNASKGPAVRARRVQCDMGGYQAHMRSAVEACERLALLQGMVVDIDTRLEGGRRAVTGLQLEGGRRLEASQVVLTTGTFLRGLMHIGLRSEPGGRVGDPPDVHLSDALVGLGFELGRLKTGTPARLASESVNLSGLVEQRSDPTALPFSHAWSGPKGVDLPCYLTRTNEKTHDIIRANLDRSPLFSGRIEGVGARYCPSIEDKVVKFPDRLSHQVILEPTDMSQQVIYPNGISTSLPEDVQVELIRSIEGLEEAEMLQPGYGIEYDFVYPTQLRCSLETRAVDGLFLAGQINGTSGYEEAAGQGLVAGVNAARKVAEQAPIVLGRQEAYIGVMIDDLVTRGTREPYRMFSSRAEFRLLLREDNAVERLADAARQIGIVDAIRLEARDAANARVDSLVQHLRTTLAAPDRDGRRPSLEILLRRPGVRLEELMDGMDGWEPDLIERAEVRIKYQGYVDRQIHRAERLGAMLGMAIPEGLVYGSLPGLSRELAEKLERVRPETLGQASRIDGMTPAALDVLSLHLAGHLAGSRRGVPRGT
ncbi:MAG: tRNA uridine-5-carboxymethylaminomethyl(34) synthesis enzyme MnmG [Deltaproteobacteria bacterium]|nr:tRNA uridine-5-carboxymethylaminomethyl(34) synthesis enzyme MnmG [Deltaproteobacteria bacterium]